MKSNLECGAVCGIKTVKNPISLARRVMENTKHVYLYGEGAGTSFYLKITKN